METGPARKNEGLLGHLLLLFLAVVGLLVFILFYNQAFPAASIDMKVTRDEAHRIARTFLQSRGFPLAGYDTAVAFASDDVPAVYLQKTQGMERANQLMKSTVPVWYWACRWFRPLQQEEYRVAVEPSGRVIRFHRELPEDRAGANLAQTAAAGIAERFLKDVMQVNLSGYERVEASSAKRQKRTDHTFVWKQKGFHVADAEMRLSVEVQGDKVGVFRQFLKVPDRFNRSYQRESSVGQLLSLISLGFMLILGLLALAVFIAKAMARDIRWKFGLVFALAILVLFVAGGLNGIPVLKANYPTQIGYGTFLAIAIVGILFASILYGVFILLAGAAGDALTREIYPHSVGTLSDLIQGRIATREFALSAFRGYSLAGILVGYLVIFYLVGRRFLGVWLPASSPYSNMLNTALPFLYPLLVGFVAATSEEFTFRFFAIPLLKKYLKVTFLALLIPAVIWAFGHSDYPVFPVYVRGIELTIAGLIFGYAFIRFDLLTCIIAHYALDALLVALPLFHSTNRYFIVSGALVVTLGLLPAVAALFGLRRQPKALPAGL